MRTLRTVRPAIYAATAVFAWYCLRLPPGDEAEGGRYLAATILEGAGASLLLWLALMSGASTGLFPHAAATPFLLRSRRAFGVSSAGLSALHGWHGLYGRVGGFGMLKYWGADYAISLLEGALALLILALLAATSFDAAARAMGRSWKSLHRWVYLALVLVLAHAASVTIHVLDLFPVLLAWFAAMSLLLALEFLRVARRGRAGLAMAGFAAASSLLFWSTFLIGHHRH